MPQPEKETRELSGLERWQVSLDEADRGEFASDEEVEQTLKRLMRGRPTGKS